MLERSKKFQIWTIINYNFIIYKKKKLDINIIKILIQLLSYYV